MKKRSSGDGEELLLFDLPLQDHRLRDPSPELAKREKAARPPAPKAEAAPALEQPRLITEATPALEAPPLVLVDHGVGVVERLLAGAADLFLHLVVVAATALAVAQMGLPLRGGDWPAFLMLGLLLSCIYMVIALAFWGQTPGMAWMGQVARSVTDEPLTFGQTFLRWLGALLTLGLAGLPLLLVFAGGRSMSDRLSDSKTLHLRLEERA